MSNRFQNGKIYKIVSADYSKCYIGSTCEELSQRMARHRRHYRLYQNGRNISKVRTIDLFDEFGIDNCKIEWIEDYPCNSRKELEAREGHHIQSNNCVNKIIVGRTEQEYREQNRDKINEKQRTYREQNRETINEKNKAYYEENKDRLMEKQKAYAEQNKGKISEQQKAYRDKNKEHLREQKKAYTEQHKERIKQQHSKPFHCGCGSVIRTAEQSRHCKTQKHQDWLNQQQEEQEQPLKKLD